MLMSLPDPRTVLLQPMVKIPVTIVSGFLGSGKTTLIRNFLSQNPDTAVIVNEFGEIGIDHLLMETSDENIALLPGGCLCCQAKNDLVRALRSLQARSANYRRVIIETSGLADPAPILQTFLSDPLRLSQYQLAGLVSVADALLGIRQLAQYQTAQNQIALADRILITKLDRVAVGESAALVRSIAHYNAHAEIEACSTGTELRRQLCAFEPHLRSRWQAQPAMDDKHNKAFASFSLPWQAPLHLEKFYAGLIELANLYDVSLLRLKGIINAVGEGRSAKIHAVQHLVEWPQLLPNLPTSSWRGLVVVCKRPAYSQILTALHGLLHQASLRQRHSTSGEIEYV